MKTLLYTTLALSLIAETGTAFSQPIQGSISAYAQAFGYNVNLTQPPPDTSTQTEFWNTNPISPENVTAFATQSADAGYGPSSATTSVTETATWAPDGTSGTFSSDYTLASSPAAAYVLARDASPSVLTDSRFGARTYLQSGVDLVQGQIPQHILRNQRFT